MINAKRLEFLKNKNFKKLFKVAALCNRSYIQREEESKKTKIQLETENKKNELKEALEIKK